MQNVLFFFLNKKKKKNNQTKKNVHQRQYIQQMFGAAGVLSKRL